MTDRPSTPPPGDADPQHPQQVTPGAPPPTAPLPPAVPPPAGSPSAGPPPPYGPAPSAAAGAPSGPRRLWGEATSTGGGRAALVAAAILGTLLLVTGVGLVAALVWDDGPDWDDRVSISERPGPGNGNGLGQGKRNGNGNGMGNGQGNGMGRGLKDRGDDDLDEAPGLGRGRGGGAVAPGDVLHGEFTTGVTGTPTVMLVQTGVVTAYTAGKSIAVESADGFSATYSLDGAVAVPRTAPVATGAQVRVVAAKSGMTVTRLDVLD